MAKVPVRGHDESTLGAVPAHEAPTVAGSVRAAAHTSSTPTTIGRFEVLGVLGAGGMGIVYRGFDRSLGREVALKLVNAHGGADGQTRLLREAQAMARVAHANVIPVYEVAPHGEGVAVAMELVNGVTLGAWLRAEPRSWRDILRKLVDAGRGLEAVHRTGILHRDFKPDNVLVGDDGRARVADFGLARAGNDADDEARLSDSPLGLDLTQHGTVVGTPAFMSPEHISGTLTPFADQWSFAVTCYSALFGELPFKADDLEGLRKAILETTPRTPALGDVPVEVAAAVLRGMQRLPEDRFASLGDMLAALEAPLAIDPELDKNVSRRSRQRFSIIVAGCVTALFVVTGVRTDWAFDFTAKDVLIQQLVAFGFIVASLGTFRRAFLRTAHDRRIAASLVIAMLAMSGHRGIAFAAGEPVTVILLVDAVFLVAFLALVAVTIERLALVAALPMVLYAALGLAVPSVIVPGFGLAMLAIIVLAAVLWRDPKLTAARTSPTP